MNWDGNQLRSFSDQTAVLLSLVALIKDGHHFDGALEKKAEALLSHITPFDSFDAEDFLLLQMESSSNDSLSDFVNLTSVLISSSQQLVVKGTMNFLDSLLSHCPPQFQMNLISVDLIPQIFIALNPLSLSFADAEDIHACLISIVNSAVLLGTPHLREILTNEHNHDQQRVHETVLQQLLVPSEAYLRNLCTNRHSIIDGRLSAEFMTLLADIILISPFCRPIMDFVVNMPVVLTITSSLTFFNNDGSIHIPLTVLSSSMEKWNEQCRDVRRTWPTIVRSLRMEGMDNVTEQRMHNNREGMIGQEVANNSIKLSNLQGMNTK